MVFDKEKKESVENLKSFVIQEADFQMAAAETIHGLYQIGNKVKNILVQVSNRIKVNTKRSVYSVT